MEQTILHYDAAAGAIPSTELVSVEGTIWRREAVMVLEADSKWTFARSTESSSVEALALGGLH